MGSRLAALARVGLLERDAQLPGDRITILDELAVPGGSLDGVLEEHKGFFVRGGRDVEEHFETLWGPVPLDPLARHP